MASKMILFIMGCMAVSHLYPGGCMSDHGYHGNRRDQVGSSYSMYGSRCEITLNTADGDGERERETQRERESELIGRGGPYL